MANRRVSMRKIRELTRLYEECGLSNRQIARALKICHPVVGQYLVNLKASRLTYQDIKAMSDDEVMEIIEKGRQRKSERYGILFQQFDYLLKELKKPGVTLELLWQEYKQKCPAGYAYSQFCYHFQVWRGLSSLTMHIEHKAGETMFVDYTGKRLTITDELTGKVREVEVLVAILAASQLTYVEATETQKKEDWVRANENALQYFGGVPQIIVPDCLRSAVTKADRYEPDINPLYADFARHYGTAIVPARPGSPKDKALAEGAVKITYRRVFAPLRNETFYSLEELNQAVRDRLEEHNNMPFQRMKISRRELFEKTEKELLKALPPQRYELKNFRRLKVPSGYHIEIREDNHYYSVPWQYRGKRVTVIYTTRTVEVYHNNMRIAWHKREKQAGYTTLKEHLPPKHRFYLECTPKEMVSQAEAIGGEVKALVEEILDNHRSPQQALRVCMGIISLCRRYGPERVNQASKRALEFNSHSYKVVRRILEKGLDRLKEDPLSSWALPSHKNIRGNAYFS